MLERATDPFLGAWFPVEGAIEPGEDAAAAALREIREETGLAPIRFYRQERSPRVVGSGGATVLLHLFVGVVHAEAGVVLNREHRAYEWVTISEAIRRVPLASQRIALRELDRRFVRRRPPDRLRIDHRFGP